MKIIFNSSLIQSGVQVILDAGSLVFDLNKLKNFSCKCYNWHKNWFPVRKSGFNSIAKIKMKQKKNR